MEVLDPPEAFQPTVTDSAFLTFTPETQIWKGYVGTFYSEKSFSRMSQEKDF